MKSYHKDQEVDRMMMRRNHLLDQIRKNLLISIIPAVIGFISFCLFYFLSRKEYKLTNDVAMWKGDILRYGFYFTLSLYAWISGRICKILSLRKIRFLLFYPCAIFFALLIINYGINDILEYYSLKFENDFLDYLLHTNKVILTAIITTGLCWIIYLFSRRR